MMVRNISWYRTEEEMLDDFFIIRLLPWRSSRNWESFSFLDFGGSLTREQFEKQYWEWRTQNEG